MMNGEGGAAAAGGGLANRLEIAFVAAAVVVQGLA